MAKRIYDEASKEKNFLSKMFTVFNLIYRDAEGYLMAECEECGRFVYSEDSFCPKCGAKLEGGLEISLEEKRAIFFKVMQELADKLELGLVHKPVEKEETND